MDKRNRSRQKRLTEEMAAMKPLPSASLSIQHEEKVPVSLIVEFGSDIISYRAEEATKACKQGRPYSDQTQIVRFRHGHF